MKELNIGLLASGVAFWAMLSIFPALIALVMVYGLVSDPADVTKQIDDALSGLSEDAKKLVGNQVSSVAASRSGALSVGLIISLALLLWAMSSGVANLMQAVTAAYEQEETRGFVKLRALALGLALGALMLGVLLVAAIGVVPAVLREVLGSPGLRWVLLGVEGLLLLALLIFALALVYRLAPAQRPATWRWISPGAVFGGIAIVVFTLAFAFYVNAFGSYNKTYGALAGVIILMVWLYYSAYMVLVGGLMNAEGERQARLSRPAAAQADKQVTTRR
jgi:membrane protein